MAVALTALFVALGGTGYAATQLPAGHRSGHASAKKKKPANENAQDLALFRKNASLFRGPAGPQGAQGPQGAAGAAGAAGPTGPAGTARAYGLIGTTSATSVTRSKNIASVTNPQAGLFCITLAAGIDPTTTLATVTPDYNYDSTVFGSTNYQTIAEVDDSVGGCPAGTAFSVVTGYRSTTTAADPQGGANFVTAVTNTPENEGFFVVVP